MADEILKSNLIIDTEFRRPNTEPLSSAHKALDRIDKRLTDLTQKKWVIKLEVDDSSIRALGLTMQRQKVSSGNSGRGAAGNTPPGTGGSIVSSQTSTKLKEGAIVSLETSQRREKVEGNILRIQKDASDEVKDTVKSQTQALDLIKQQDVLEEKRAVRRRAEALRRGRQAGLALEGQQLAQSVRQDIAAGQVPLTLERDSGKFLFDRIAAYERAAAGRRAILEKKVFPAEKKEAEEYRNKELKRIDEQAAIAAKGIQQEIKLSQDRDSIIAENHLKTSLREIDDQIKAAKKGTEEEIRLSQKRDAIIADHHKKTSLKKIDEDLKNVEKGSRAEIALQQKRDAIIADHHKKTVLGQIDAQKRIDETTQKQILASQRRLSTREAGDYAKEQAHQRASSILGTGADQLLQQGFQERAPTRVFNALTGKLEETRNLVRTTGSAWSGYTVEIARANTATGKMTVQVLQGAQAMRFMGDRIESAVAKVATWSLATSLVFGTVAALGLASQKVQELEENTVLLARVGQSFGRGSFGLPEDFPERLRIAQKLTEQILELTTVYGGNAAEAQRAATIFARAGNDEVETLQATRAALIATRIAELETEDAARLLSSAMLQFDLSASQLLPTLDGLNTLSNTYRVTTDDLLQAISRTGSVFAEHNGRLEELAGLTALVSQRTARTGAEIGNAFKTISSNLDRIDVQQHVFEKLGVSTVNFEGEAKSLGQTLLEIQGRIERLTTSEQKQLTLQVAGTRQRNILLSAIKEADQALIAENKVLVNNSTATLEFEESAGTLTAALQRIYATLVQIASLGGGSFATTAKSLLNITDSLLRVLTLFDGAPLKLAGWIGTVYLMTRAITATTGWLTRLTTQTASVTVSTAQNTAVTNANAVAHTRAAAAIAAHAAAQRTGQNAAGLASRTTGMTNAGAAYAAGLPGPSRAGVGIGAAGILAGVGRMAGPIALGLTIALPLLSQFAQAQNIATDSINQSIQAGQNSIQLEERRRQAIARTVSALADLNLQYQNLNRQGKTKQAADVQQRATALGGSIGLKLSSGNFLGEAVQQAGVLQQTSIEEQRKATQKLVADLAAKQAQSKERRELLDSYLRNAEQSGFARLYTGAESIGQLPNEIQRYFSGTGSKTVGGIEENAIDKTLSKYSNEAAKLLEEEKQIQEEINAAQEQANSLQKQGYDLKQNQARLDQLVLQQEKNRVAFLEETKLQAAESFRIELDSSKALEVQLGSHQRIADLAKLEADTLDEIFNLQKEIDPKIQEKAFERANKLLEDQLKLFQEISKAAAASGQSNLTSVLGIRNQLREKSSQIFLEQNRRTAGDSTYGDRIAEIDLRRQKLAERLRLNKLAADQLPGITTSTTSTAGTSATPSPVAATAVSSGKNSGPIPAHLLSQLSPAQLAAYQKAQQSGVSGVFDPNHPINDPKFNSFFTNSKLGQSGSSTATSSPASSSVATPPAGTPSITTTTTVNSATAADKGKGEALKQDSLEAINELRDLEAEKALSILEAEKEITLERQKQAENAAKSLTTLSQEDKLRVIALGSYFQKNPGKTLSFDEQLAINGKGNQLLQQFYGGRLEQFKPGSSPIAGRLAAGGFGSTVETERGAAEVAAARGGRTDQQLLEAALDRSSALQDQGAQLRGETADAATRGFTSRALTPGLRVNPGSGTSTPAIAASIKVDSIDFKPLTDAFQLAVDVKIDAAVQRMVDETNRISDRLQALEKRRTTPNRQATP